MKGWKTVVLGVAVLVLAVAEAVQAPLTEMYPAWAGLGVIGILILAARAATTSSIFKSDG